MAFKQITPMSVVNDHLQEELDRRQAVLVRNLHITGERCMIEGKTNHRYLNQTGNLEASLGYILIVDGVIITQSSGTNADGAKFLQELASKESLGIVLIVGAGMQYAKYVNDKGLNVLDSPELLADRLMRELIKKLKG